MTNEYTIWLEQELERQHDLTYAMIILCLLILFVAIVAIIAAIRYRRAWLCADNRLNMREYLKRMSDKAPFESDAWGPDA